MQVPVADYHTHTPLCLHASGAPVEYVRRAQAVGLAEIGISDHNPMPKAFDDWRMKLEDLPRYLDWVAEARQAVAPFPVRLGLECDFIPGEEAWVETLAEKAPWDYFIGSVHYLAPGWDVDNPKWIGKFTETSVEEIWKLYFEAQVKCIRSGLFDLIGHPDLVKKFGHRPTGDLRGYYEATVQAAADTGIAVEINTAGLRKPAGEMYPARAFICMLAEAGVPIAISSDAHSPEEVGGDFDKAITLVQECGFTSTVRFEARRRSLVPLEVV